MYFVRSTITVVLVLALDLHCPIVEAKGLRRRQLEVEPQQHVSEMTAACKACKKTCAKTEQDYLSIASCKDVCRDAYGKEACSLTSLVSGNAVAVPSRTGTGDDQPRPLPNTDTNKPERPDNYEPERPDKYKPERPDNNYKPEDSNIYTQPDPFDRPVHGTNRAADTCARPVSTKPFPLTDCNWQPVQAPDGKEMNKFGAVVAIDGDWMAAGAPGDSRDRGSVYVYAKTQSGFWSFHQKLTPVSGQPGDAFNYATISGDTIAVGAKLSDFYGKDSGAAYVYRYSHGRDKWTLEAKIVPSDGETGDYFGNTLDVRGDKLLVGARLHDRDAGAVYYYHRRNGIWIFEQKITIRNARAGDQFGARVMLDNEGQSAILTAHKRNEYGPESGAAYVFNYINGQWRQDQVLIPNDGTAFAEFGVKADMDGDTAVIGAWKDDEDGFESGSAYVFKKFGGFWAQTAKLSPSDGGKNHQFGRSVAVKNGVILVGAMENFNVDDSGSVYVFTGDGEKWRQQTKLTSPNLGVNEDHFGKTIAIDCLDQNSYTAIVGARYNSDQGYRSGNAYSVRLCA